MASRVGTRWRGRVVLPSGKEMTKRFTLKRDAVAWENANRGRQEESRDTLARWLDLGGRESVLAGLGEATRRLYAAHLKLRIIPDLGYRRLAKITAAHIETARDAWLRDGLSPAAVTSTLNCLARVFRQAVKARAVAKSPMLEVDRPKASAPVDIPTITPVEIEKLAAACTARQPAYGDYVRLASYLGLRAGELTALQVRDIDLQTGVVTVSRAFSAGKLQTTKSGRTRQVPIVDAVRSTLARLVKEREKDEWLLVGPFGGRFRHNNFRAGVDWRNLVRQQGYPGFRFHDLRATAIVLWIKAGIPLATVRAMAGHASLATTDRYARTARNDLKSAASAMNSFLTITSPETNQPTAREAAHDHCST